MTTAPITSDLDRVLFEEAPVGLAFLDRDLRFVRVNRRLADLNGRTVEELVGRRLTDAFPDVSERVLEAFERVLETGAAIEGLEVETHRGDPPRRRTFVAGYRPVRDGDAIMGVAVSSIEITAQKEAEEEARRSRDVADLLAALNARLAASSSIADAANHVVEATGPAFGAATGGLFLLDSDGMLRSIAARGYSDEVLARFAAWSYEAPSPGGTAMRARELRAWSTLEAVEEEFRDLGAAMREITGERAIASAPLIVDGEPIGALHVGFDAPRELSREEIGDLRAIAEVTAEAIRRIRLTDAERRSRRVLEAVIDQMPLGVILAGARGELTIMNAESRRIWGGIQPASSVFEYAGYRAFHPDGEPYELEDWPLARSLATGEVITDEDIEIETFDGRRRVLEDASAPIRDDDGSILGAVVVFTDVTEKREASALRDAFIGMLSHELRTPITSIYGVANLLEARGTTMDPEIRAGLLEDMRAESDRLFRLVENLLVLARAERGATTIEAVPVLVHRLVPRIVESEAAAWPALQIRFAGPDHLPPVRADEGFVDLILRNLIGNAAKYAPGPVEVRAEHVDGEIRIDVCDSGVGIPEAELDHVFELFRRVARPGRPAVPGSGIGLYVVRHLAQAMGGRAWARNRPEGGADVGFSLPVDPEAA